VFQRLSRPKPGKLLLAARARSGPQATYRRLNLPRQRWRAKPEKGWDVGRRRTRITIATGEIVVARRIVSPVVAWCQRCETETGMVTLTQAAVFCHIDRSAIQEWIDSGQVHVLETPETGLLICITSLGRHQ